MATILVTGANGQLGSEIQNLTREFGQHEFLMTDLEKLNITSLPSLKKLFNNNKVEYIINCAAFTDVDKAEEDKKEAEKVNIVGVSNLAKLASNYQIKMFHISTDYVFDGQGSKPYSEDSPVNPLGVYGQTKYKGEVEARRHTQTMIIRTSWLYSKYGKNFLKTILRLGEEKSEIGVVYDQVGSPTNAADLAALILNIIDGTERDASYFKPGIYHYTNEGVCSWYDFAMEIKYQSGFDCKINPIRTENYPTPAKRPAYSVLDKKKITQAYNLEIPYWRYSLVKCLNELVKK
ncbi:MAG: dTDP-4-dehydrorhamnose reductase [Bacteroidetes bacterium HGW-Bacteroidetes-21]|jgi:dTDP-4-dehydrorhamnose reductase|nr:MAG: dTDP-4-dehydrorhamnose reductase [Bacteroidetes bacterium HGW-Bacteroidetes-21]